MQAGRPSWIGKFLSNVPKKRTKSDRIVLEKAIVYFLWKVCYTKLTIIGLCAKGPGSRPAPAFKYFPGTRTVEKQAGTDLGTRGQRTPGRREKPLPPARQGRDRGHPSSYRCAMDTAPLSWVFLSGYIKSPGCASAGPGTEMVMLLCKELLWQKN